MRRSTLLLVLLTTALSAACVDEDGGASPAVVQTQVGDTTVVRTVTGSHWAEDRPWTPRWSVGALDGPPETVFGRLVSIALDSDGRVLAVDRQVPVVRVFSGEGTYLQSWGRRGQGPGELESPDAGLGVLPDGRVVVRDPGNGRLQLFSPEGEAVGTWPVITGQYINRRSIGTWSDTLINPDLVNPTDPLPEWRLGLVRVGPDGSVLDTLAIPESGRRAHRFVARSGGNAAEIDLPFASTEHWAWHPDGYVVHGVGDRYAITLDRPGGPLRIEREVTPMEVTPEERQQEEERVFNAMRWLDRDWQWRGPSIPETKPSFSGLLTGLDGRVWVSRDGETFEVEDDDYDPSDPFDTEIRWRQETVLDAFQPDGTFLGSVTMPRDLDTRVPPVLLGDTLWAVTRDELGVQRIVRYELSSP